MPGGEGVTDVALMIRLGDAADVDSAVSVFERSNMERREGSWPNRVARVQEAKAHLRDPSSWFVVANDGSAGT
jgi:hypothetical protein